MVNQSQNLYTTMKHITKLKLAAVHQLCDTEGRSTEYMVQVMQDIVKVNLDTVVNYVNLGPKRHKELFREVNEFAEVLANANLTIPKL